MNPIGLLVIACGVFSCCGAAYDWEWFMNSYRGRWIVNVFGRSGARIFYWILGLGLIVVGLGVTFSII